MATAQGGGPAFEAQARRPSLSAVKRGGQAESEVQARGCRAYATPDDRKPLREQSSRYALANTPELRSSDHTYSAGVSKGAAPERFTPRLGRNTRAAKRSMSASRTIELIAATESNCVCPR